MHNKILAKTVSNSRGFSLLEVLLGITVFMIGMLGVTALNISSLKSSTFAGNMSEAVIIAGDKIEELMALDFDDALLSDSASPNDDGTGQDGDNDGLDDDHPDDTDAGPNDGKPNFGLDDTGTGAGEADHWELNVGRKDIAGNGIYNVYWNVAVAEPLNEKTKTVNVIVEWDIKGNIRRMNMSTIILDHD